MFVDGVDGVSPEAGRGELGVLDLSALEETEEADVDLKAGAREDRDLVSSPKEGLVYDGASNSLFLGVIISESRKP